MDEFRLSKLRAGDGIKLELPSDEVSKLHAALDKFRAVAEGHGFQFGKTELVVAEKGRVVEVIDSQHAEVIKELIARNHTRAFWKTLRTADPDLASHIANLQVLRDRQKALKTFESHLHSLDWTEPKWKEFFESNDWIFGFGLSSRFLRTVQTEAHYGGTNASGRGTQRGEFLAASEGAIRTATLVEIKRPDSPLFAQGNYRNGVPNYSTELIQAISQMQVNARTWDTEGSRRTGTATNSTLRGFTPSTPKPFW